MLSNFSIAKELNKNIFIYPLITDNIRGATVNLTASEHAWSLKTRDKIYDNDVIKIPAHDTALIETNENIHVTKKIAGTYHSKVQLVSRGLGHIGTTLDPTWFGHSLIALHNNTDDPIEIKRNESIVSLTFHYLNEPAKNFTLDNHSGRYDVLQKLHMSNIPETMGEEGVGQLDKFKKMCREKEKDTIKHYLESYEKHFYTNRNFWLITCCICILAATICYIVFSSQPTPTTPNFVVMLSVGLITFFLGKLIK